MIIEQVQEENRSYYIDYQKRLIGELLIYPVGSNKGKGNMRKLVLMSPLKEGADLKDVYLVSESDPSVKNNR